MMTNKELNELGLALIALIDKFFDAKKKYDYYCKKSRQLALSYQTKLELKYEKDDLRNQIIKLDSDINERLSWYKCTGRWNALEAYSKFMCVRGKSSLFNYLNSMKS